MPDTLFDLEPEAAPDAHLPPLRGSERQIEWAVKIRRGKLKRVADLLEDWRRLIELYGQYDAAQRTDGKADEARVRRKEALDALARLEAETSAKWWIDHRDATARELVAEVAKPAAASGKWSRT